MARWKSFQWQKPKPSRAKHYLTEPAAMLWGRRGLPAVARAAPCACHRTAPRSHSPAWKPIAHACVVSRYYNEIPAHSERAFAMLPKILVVMTAIGALASPALAASEQFGMSYHVERVDSARLSVEECLATTQRLDGPGLCDCQAAASSRAAWRLCVRAA